MNRRTIQKLTLAGSLLWLAAPILAKPDYTGVWKLDRSRSDMGPLSNVSVLVRTITHDDPRLVIEIVVERGAGKEGGELRFLTNGEETTNRVADVETTGQVMWLGNHLLMRTTRDVNGLRTRIDELWTLSADGKTLQIDAVVTTQMGREDIIAVFAKE